jgi:hypothetical protein
MRVWSSARKQCSAASRRWNIGTCPKVVMYPITGLWEAWSGRMLGYVAVPLLTHRRDKGPGIGLTCPGAAKPRKQDFLKSITSMSSMKTTCCSRQPCRR